MLEFLSGIGITHQTIDELIKQCEGVIAMLTQGGTSASVSQCVWACVTMCVIIRGYRETKRHQYAILSRLCTSKLHF